MFPHHPQSRAEPRPASFLFLISALALLSHSFNCHHVCGAINYAQVRQGATAPQCHSVRKRATCSTQLSVFPHWRQNFRPHWRAATGIHRELDLQTNWNQNHHWPSIVLQLRQTVFNFVQKELAPKAAEIDKTNNFPELRVSIFFS